jgi:elongation factor P
MVLASQLRPGMAIIYDHHLYKVLAADYHPGQGKMGGVMHSRLLNLDTGTQWEQNFRAELRLEDSELARIPMDFLYEDSSNYYFMNPSNFDQAALPDALLGPQARVLQPGMRLTVEFSGERPVGVVFPDMIESRVKATAPPLHGQPDAAMKPATLASGVEVMVPQFIKEGDAVRVDLRTMKYMDRVKTR